MPLIDFILNLTGLLLWLNWLSIQFDPIARATPASLVGTLRKTDPSGPRRWQSLAGLGGLLLARAVIYWEFSASTHWNPRLDLGVIALSFRGDNLRHLLLFSVASFVCTLAVFYFWLLLLSVANSRVPDTDPFQKLVRVHLKWLEKQPALIKVFIPFILGAVFWLVLHPMLAQLAIVPARKSLAQVFEQAAIIGAAAYLTWKYLLVGILLLHLLSSYVYFGNHPFWNFVNATATNMLAPLRWLPLRIGRVDFLPILAVAIVFFLSELVTNPPHWFNDRFRDWFYHALPF